MDKLRDIKEARLTRRSPARPPALPVSLPACQPASLRTLAASRALFTAIVAPHAVDLRGMGGSEQPTPTRVHLRTVRVGYCVGSNATQ